MVRIRQGKQVVFEGAPKVEFDFPKPAPTLEELDAKRMAELINNFTEIEARAACQVLVRNYPGLYFNEFIKEYADKAAKLEAIKTVCERK